MKNKKKLILLSLNEINFEIAKKYSNKYEFQNFNKIINKNENNFTTFSETNYDLLEPWIQWVSVYTGLSAKEHKVFRLGDSAESKNSQIFEKLEELNFSVGAISSMNVINVLKSPIYFIPDPWTKTKSDNSFWSKLIYKVIKHSVNNNAKNKLNFKSIISLIFIFLRFVRLRNYFIFIILFLSSFKKKWKKSIFLDLLMHEIHLNLLKNYSPNFSNIFFNAGAHIQHHYFFKSEFVNYKNNKEDPLKDALYYYDKILKDYLNIKEYDFIISTGLSQTPNPEPSYYYRLKNHKKFLDNLNINYKEVLPRMSRDFLIKFKNYDLANKAQNILSNLKTNEGINIFNKIDNRGNSLFVTLTYSKKISKNTTYEINDLNKLLLNDVVFVAIKNGIHNSLGYVFLSDSIKNLSPKKSIHIKDLHKLILNYFKL